MPPETSINQNAFVPGEILVLTRESNLSDEELISSIKSSSQIFISSVEKLHNFNLEKSAAPHGKRFLTLKFDEKTDPQIVADSIKNNPSVLFAEPNFIGVLAMIPGDPIFPFQWGLRNDGSRPSSTYDADIDAPETWDIELGASSIIIAFLDTGIDLNHEDLATKILPGWDPLFNDFIPEDVDGHGTWVTGVAAAITNNGLGVAGTCPNCMILPIKVGQPNTNLNATYKALEFAVGNPQGIEGIPPNPYFADVINMSIAFTSHSALLQQGILDAYNAGAVLVAAAGNNNYSFYTYPAAYNEVIAVAATDENDAKAGFSNYGTWVDIAAPGVFISTTDLNNGYTGPSGTSLSAPMVAGVIGLILSRPNAVLTASQIRQALIDTSDPVTGFPAIGGGRVNAYNALTTNIAPVINSVGNKTTQEMRWLTIDLSATDGNGDALTFSTDAASVLPSQFSFN
ncbi:MAG: S8 family serine peptidase, partial [Bacteroidota bacterium]|nr:S8 family serine peptidase [Bacteroidota bacterium]